LFYVSGIYVLPERVSGKYLLPSSRILSNSNGDATLKELEFNELPIHVENLFDNNHLLKILKKSSRVTFGAVDSDISVKEIISPNGRRTYTLVLKPLDISKSKTNYYFDNLIVSGDDTENVGYIARYQPSQKWLNIENRDYDNYSGSITYYTLDGKKINSLLLSNGVHEPSQTQFKGAENECHDFIAQTYINSMTDILQEYGEFKGYFPYGNDSLKNREFYEDLAWGGLENTNAFNSLSWTDRKRIKDVIRIELYGKDSHGNVKTQKGKNADC